MGPRHRAGAACRTRAPFRMASLGLLAALVTACSGEAAVLSTTTAVATSAAATTTAETSTTAAPTSTTLAPTTTLAVTTTTTLPGGSPSADCVNGWMTPEPWSDLSRTPFDRLRAFYGLSAEDVFVTEVTRYFHGPSPLFGGYDLEFWFVTAWLQGDTSFRGHWLVLQTPAGHPYGVLLEPFLFAPYAPSTSPAGASWMSFWGHGGSEPGGTPVPGLPGSYPSPGSLFREAPGVPLLDPTIAGCIPAEWLPVTGP
jgi:hypothetical protein